MKLSGEVWSAKLLNDHVLHKHFSANLRKLFFLVIGVARMS